MQNEDGQKSVAEGNWIIIGANVLVNISKYESNHAQKSK